MSARVLAALTGVAVLVTGGGLLAVDAAPPTGRPDRAPTESPLVSQQILCPGGPSARAALTSTAASGAVRVHGDPVELRRRARTTAPRPPFSADGRRALAPGLVGSVTASAAGAGTVCGPPSPEYWFTGVGAASLHASTLELTNPDGSGAVAEVEILGQDGPVDAGSVRSLTVPGGASTSVDLADRVPSRQELAVHVTVVRGRLGAAVIDRIDDLGAGSDWLSASAPTTRPVLLGPAPGGTGSRTLVLANPGDDQVSVDLQVVDTESSFTPVGREPVAVPARSVVALDVGSLVGRALREDALGLQVVSDGPVSATLRSVTGGDLSHAVASPAFTEAALLLPALTDPTATLVLAAPEAAGGAVVTAYDAGGRRLRQREVGVRRSAAVRLDLPARTSLVTVRASGEALAGAVRVESGPRVVTLPLTPLVTTALVPAVAPRPAGG